MKHWIIHPGESTNPARLGAKAAALATLDGFDVPPWFVVSHEAISVPADETMRADMTEAVHRAALALAGEDGRLAVRSSAVCEDGAEDSYAGQFASYLNVAAADVFAHVQKVWESASTQQVTGYRAERGVEAAPVAMSVLVQRMLEPDIAGVAFAVDPVTGDASVAVIAAVAGCGEALVSGNTSGETLHVDQRGRVQRRTAPDAWDQGLVSDDLAARVAQLVRDVSAMRGTPQDIEWAWADDRLSLLQARPITSVHRAAQPSGAITIWDNSNIAESYCGVTTPLTFSFARRAYEEVYRTFCGLMGVPRDVITANDAVFRHMLGSLKGRVYYNLLNWYRLVAMLPGYRMNAGFMEQMMGVQDALPDAVRASLRGELPAANSNRLADALRLVRAMGALGWRYFTLGRRIGQFEQRLACALDETQTSLGEMRAEDLVAAYRDLERQLLPHWDAPILNDFFTMISYGVLRKQAQRLSADGNITWLSDLLGGVGDVVSTQPAVRIRAMAQHIVDDHATRDARMRVLCEGDAERALKAITDEDALRAMYDAYIADYGERCLQELKLESPTLQDDPTPLLRSIGAMARRLANGDDQSHPTGTDTDGASEQHIRERTRGRLIRRVIFKHVLKRTHARMRDRENLRFARTKVFGRVRRIFVHLGKRLTECGLLDEPRDIFLLEVEEAVGAVTGVLTTTDVGGLVALRRRTYESQLKQSPLPSRFETHGPVNPLHIVAGRDDKTSTQDDAHKRAGIGCCPGRVRGRARIIHDPVGVTLGPGDIIIAERTDPGWVLLFPAASAIVVEHGSILSHASIVARELNVPCVVAVHGVMAWLHDGDEIEIDGRSGKVWRIGESSRE
jgi:phosphohistidine swiveling domain-containing protein